jgi:3-isopropylmalate dehydrogenase
MARRSFHIAILPGDGIGVEVMDACLFLLERLTDRLGGPRLAFERLPAGVFCYRDTGEALPARSLERVQAADAILFGAMGWPDIRYPDGTDIAPQLDLRTDLNLYAGLRPIRLLPCATRVRRRSISSSCASQPKGFLHLVSLDASKVTSARPIPR